MTAVAVVNAQPQIFEEAQACTVETPRKFRAWSDLELVGGVGDVGEDGLNLGFGKDDGEAFVLVCVQGFDAGEFYMEDLFLGDAGLYGAVSIVLVRRMLRKSVISMRTKFCSPRR